MNRKHNPLVSVVALLLLAVILVLVCAVSAGCAAKTTTTDRFTVTDDKGNKEVIDGIYIITDTETGVQYIMVDGYNGIGLTVLQPGEG